MVKKAGRAQGTPQDTTAKPGQSQPPSAPVQRPRTQRRANLRSLEKNQKIDKSEDSTSATATATAARRLFDSPASSGSSASQSSSFSTSISSSSTVSLPIQPEDHTENGPAISSSQLSIAQEPEGWWKSTYNKCTDWAVKKITLPKEMSNTSQVILDKQAELREILKTDQFDQFIFGQLDPHLKDIVASFQMGQDTSLKVGGIGAAFGVATALLGGPLGWVISGAVLGYGASRIPGSLSAYQEQPLKAYFYTMLVNMARAAEAEGCFRDELQASSSTSTAPVAAQNELSYS